MEVLKLQGATHDSYESEWERKAREYATKKTTEKDDGKTDVNTHTDFNNRQHEGKTEMEAEDDEMKIEKIKNQLTLYPMSFELMEKLIKLLSNTPGRENLLAHSYEMILNEYPLCFGYWKRLAKMHLDKEQYSSAETIYKSGVKYLSQNPHYYLSYLKCLTDNPMKSLEEIRAVMEQALNDAGLHWKAYQLWVFVIDFEEKIFKSFTDETSEKEKQTCFNRIKSLYYRFLSTPLEESNKSLEKFKNFISGGNEKSCSKNSANSFFFDFFDLLSDEEIIQLLRKLHEKSSGSLRKRKLNEKNAAVTLNGTTDEYPMIKIKYMDGRECIWIESNKTLVSKLKDVLIFACENSNIKKTDNQIGKKANDIYKYACFAYQNKLIGNNEEELNRNVELLFNFSDSKNMTELFFYEGSLAIKKKAESLGSQNAVENLCMEIREQLHQQNLIEFNKILPYEQKIPRWFFHPDALKVEHLVAWREYLDFEENQNNNSNRLDMLYKRVLEVCCNYVEFWRRKILKLIKEKNFKEVENLFEIACYHLLRRRPDMYFEYAEFAEGQGKINKAEELLDKIINTQTGVAPGLVEGWIKMIALKRRMNEYEECKNLFSLAEKHFENKPKCLALLAMEKSLFLQINFNDTETAISVLKNEWEKQQDNFSLFKFCINFCEYRAKCENKEENYKLICLLFNQALTDSQMTLIEQFKIWQSFCSYVQRNAYNIKDIIHVKRQAEKFLYEKRSELSEVNNDELQTLSTKKLQSALLLHSQQTGETYDMASYPHAHSQHGNSYYDSSYDAYAQAYNFYYPYSSATHTNTVYVPTAI